jgi:tetratricopeptide (TPR) repeat protein
MIRTSCIDQRVDRLPLAAFALTTLALAAVACGGTETRNSDSVVVPSTVPAVTGSSGGVTDVRPAQNVTYKEAEIAYNEKRYQDAVGMFSTFVEQRPDNPWGHYMLGLSAWKSGDLDRAKASFERVLELDPRHVKSLLNLSRVLLEQGQPREARERVTVALGLDSTSGEVHRLMGRVRTALNQPNEALVSYRIALSLDPMDVWSMNNMGLILVQQQQYEQALSPLARAVQIDSTVPSFQNNLGIALEHTGHYTLATKAYDAAIAADSGYLKAVQSVARVRGRKEDPSLVPIELGALADAFDREIRTARLGSLAVKKEPVPQR